MIIILGKNSFIAKHLLIRLLSLELEVVAFSHEEALTADFGFVHQGDIIINCCGVNRSKDIQDYYDGNYLFLKTILDKVDCTKTHVIHFSSLMIHKPRATMSDHYVAFADSKGLAETLIQERCRSYLIIRPCNLYGTLCKPYTNNLIVSLVHDLWSPVKRILTLNVNAYRYHLHIDTFIDKILQMILDRSEGVYNLMNDSLLSLQQVHDALYRTESGLYRPELIDGIVDDYGEIFGHNIKLDEDFPMMIQSFKHQYKTMSRTLEDNPIRDLSVRADRRGSMVEISNMISHRVYMITVLPGSVRGNHFHHEQTEEFTVVDGQITVLLRSCTASCIAILYLVEQQRLTVRPGYIHTFINTGRDACRIIVSSTQRFIPNEAPDTVYQSVFFPSMFCHDNGSEKTEEPPLLTHHH